MKLVFSMIIISLSIDLEGIVSPSNWPVRHPIKEVSQEIRNKLKNLKKIAEGDTKPERETSSKGVEQAPILQQNQLNVTLSMLSC